MRNFALIGAAGYVAPRHVRAIKDLKQNLVAAIDPKDSAGYLDSFFPNAAFFTEFEKFETFVEDCNRRLHRDDQAVDFISICSPNHLHYDHIRAALRLRTSIICEKPITIDPRNLDILKGLEEETGQRIYTILQLRKHPEIQNLKEWVAENRTSNKKFAVDLTYIAGRGDWYKKSWKSKLELSGGITINIGIHFFDLLIWIFGIPVFSKIYLSEMETVSGYTEYEYARVRWFLSTNPMLIPPNIGGNTLSYKHLIIDQREVDFSEGMQNLHTLVYKDLLDGHGSGLDVALPSLIYVHNLSEMQISGIDSDAHPKLRS